ncbi:hypothetical protein [Planctobacterium marinum]|uniref:Uncharacterized protein n=1 Tax=Planctobacterium marinum TaxID=1631968 RepID=A0AA48HL29_9ALTE|nr:hypothetical protein MACH26_27300 [Planctobacterium marinum]
MALVEILTEQQRKKRGWKRVFNLLLVASLLIVGVYLYVVEQHYQISKWHTWVDNRGQQFTAQYSTILGDALAKQGTARLEPIISNISQQPGVIEVVLFSPDGLAINNDTWLTSQHLLYNHRDSSPQIYVEELWANEQLQGYLRITLNRQHLIQALMPVVQASYRPFIIAGVLLLILGMLAGRRFALWHYKNR